MCIKKGAEVFAVCKFFLLLQSHTNVLPLCCAHLTILRVLLYFSWFTPITNMGASAEGAEMMTLLAPPFK